MKIIPQITKQIENCADSHYIAKLLMADSYYTLLLLLLL